MQSHQYFTFEITGEGTRSTHLDTIKAPALLCLEVHRKQLQASNPAIGQLMQHSSVAWVDAAELFAQKSFRLFSAEA
ncbi:hypothetical protein D3C79_976990 [compost metagenome]